METDMDDKRGQTSLERMVTHIVQAVLIAAVIGGAVLLIDLKESMAVTQTEMKASAALTQAEMKSMSTRFADFKILMSDRYTSAQAAAANAIIQKELNDHEVRLRNVEQRLNENENRFPDSKFKQ